ncbi:hypothetical protein ALC53_10737 [Atta colombica]|uniref:Uncharacterized protein n=1 Tax=Atta colombica TaxID=520822 RepID=A0A151HZT4_9HYME|nr:hypothetical protein ALC53_10737 [Atta colombica]
MANEPVGETCPAHKSMPDIETNASSNYYLFRSIQHGFDFFYCGIYLLLEKWEKVVVSGGKYFE